MDGNNNTVNTSQPMLMDDVPMNHFHKKMTALTCYSHFAPKIIQLQHNIMYFLISQGANMENRMLEDVINLIPGGVFVYSAEEDEEFSFVSRHMLDMLGYTLEEFQEKFANRFSRMVYEEDREQTLATIWDQISRGNYDTCRYRIEKKDGTLLWVHD